MSKRDEPEILADLIRLADSGRLNAADTELIEQARAALHPYVVAAGRKQIAAENSVSFVRLFFVMIAALLLGSIGQALIISGSPLWIVAGGETLIILGGVPFALSFITRARP